MGRASLIIGNYARRGRVIRIYVYHDNPEVEARGEGEARQRQS